MRNKKMMVEITKALLSVFIFGILISVATIVTVSASTAWTDPPPGLFVEWDSDQVMYTHKGAMPMFKLHYGNSGSKQTVNIKTTIQNYNSTTWVSGWRIDCLTATNPEWAFQTIHTCTGSKVWGTYTDNYDHIMDTNTASVLGIFIDVPKNTTQTSITIQVRVTNGDSINRSENGVLHIGTNITYDIDLGATPLPSTIDPEETLSHPFTIFNKGNKTVDVALSYNLEYKDEDGDTLTSTVWGISFTDINGVATDIIQNIAPAHVAYPNIVITAPEAEDAPASATLEITIIGAVCNDTRSQGRLVLGGEDTETSGEFEGDDDDDDDVAGAYGISWLYWGLIFLGVAVVAILLFATPSILRPKGRRGRKKRR